MITILQGDVIDRLRTLPDEAVQCCVTSPPYWGLRDYGTAQWEGGDDRCDHRGRERYYTEKTAAVCSHDAFMEPGKANADRLKQGRWREAGDCKCGAKRIDWQIGLEKTPEEYVAKMVEVFREVRRVLRGDGTLWLNLGDGYASGEIGRHDRSDGYDGKFSRATTQGDRKSLRLQTGLKPKDLCGIPWRVAFALQADGWWLRSDIIWSKPNPMPESVTDRPTKAHEYLFLLTKSANYFYDAEAIKMPISKATIERRENVFNDTGKTAAYRDTGVYKRSAAEFNSEQALKGATSVNKRSVWTVATAPYPEAHFATYPPDLIKPCILAGTSAKGCCAKCGSPWDRLTEKVETGRMQTKGSSWDTSSGSHGNVHKLGRGNDAPPVPVTESKTIGWQPICKCCSMHDDSRDCTNHPFGFFNQQTEPCTVLDPFAGSGTTGAVALELGRKAVLIELNPKYVELIERRCSVTMGLPLAV